MSFINTKQKSLNLMFRLKNKGDCRIWTGDDGVADRCLTAWLSHRNCYILLYKNSPSRTWTYDTSVNSRMLYRLSYWGILKTLSYAFKTSYSTYIFDFFPWSSPRPISNSQLHMLPCFHLCPIYLVVFKGSYFLLGRDISSWGGLHA